MLTIVWFISVNIVDQKYKLLASKFKWKNPKWLEIALFYILYDLDAENNISGV